MRPISFKVARKKSESVKVEHDVLPTFYDTLHVHNDYQLTLILKGQGTLYIGNQLLAFQSGDVILIGKDIPHVFKTDPSISNDSKASEGISIYFQQDFSGINFSENPDYEVIDRVLDLANQCLFFHGSILDELRTRIPEFLKYDPLKNIIALMDLLLEVAKSDETTVVSADVPAEIKLTNDLRIRNVFEYIINRHQDTITLADVAEIANMTETSFCRYFKHRTRKTFSRYLAEVRVETACTHLRSGKSSISDVCYESGFQNLSNFNRHFRQITGMSPRQYQKRQLFASVG